MRRRNVIAFLGGVAAWPFAAGARMSDRPERPDTPRAGEPTAPAADDRKRRRHDPIAAVAASLSLGQSKALVSARGRTLYDVRTSADAPDGMKNFNDPANPFWASQANLNRIKGYNGNAMLDFSRPGCRGTDGLVWTAFCGGHASSPVGGGIHSFSVQDACASILAGGDGGGWVRRQKASRFIGASGAKPAWSPQASPKPSYYTTNVDGVRMFGCNHTNDTMMAFRDGVLTSGGASGGPPNGAGLAGGEYVIGGIVTFDDRTWTPVVRQPDIARTWSGFAYFNGGGACYGLDYDPDTDAVYAIFNMARVNRWDNVSKGMITHRQVGGFDSRIANVPYGCVLVPDPNTRGAKMLFQLRSLNHPTWEWSAWTDITNPTNGRSTANLIHGTFNVHPDTIIRATIDRPGIDWEWGPGGKILIYIGGADIYAITPGRGTTGWMIDHFQTLTGDIPPLSAWSRLRCLTANRNIAVIVTKPGNVYLTRLG